MVRFSAGDTESNPVTVKVASSSPIVPARYHVFLALRESTLGPGARREASSIWLITPVIKPKTLHDPINIGGPHVASALNGKSLAPHDRVSARIQCTTLDKPGDRAPCRSRLQALGRESRGR